jgi:hypothetical protein
VVVPVNPLNVAVNPSIIVLSSYQAFNKPIAGELFGGTSLVPDNTKFV